MQASASDVEKLCQLLNLPKEVLAPQLMGFPDRGRAGPMPPVEPLIYRLYEVIQNYGYAYKAILNEKFGDGIMSAICFSTKVEKEVDEDGAAWVVITWRGKWWVFPLWINLLTLCSGAAIVAQGLLWAEADRIVGCRSLASNWSGCPWLDVNATDELLDIYLCSFAVLFNPNLVFNTVSILSSLATSDHLRAISPPRRNQITPRCMRMRKRLPKCCVYPRKSVLILTAAQRDFFKAKEPQTLHNLGWLGLSTCDWASIFHLFSMIWGCSKESPRLPELLPRRGTLVKEK